NTSIYENYQNIGEYNDIITVEKNDLGDIILLDFNSFQINKINNEIITKTSAIMSDKIENGIEIPLLAFSGLSFISGYGANVNYKSLSVSKIVGEYRSEFESSGINQTLHSVYIDVVCQVEVIFPLNKTMLETRVPVLLCQSVLVGKVPEVYLSGNLFS
ncbi:MAG: sporulation protein YunB, partial [Clostridia bacterium]|nr:sporulation protein YunB [Clostridia bacterium]